MNRVKSRILLTISLSVALGLIVACGNGSSGIAGGSSGENANKLSGSIVIDGSSTVYPVTEAVAEEFQRAHPDTRVTVGVSGTGGGFTKFCTGEIDISGASRPIRDKERDMCSGNEIEFIELRVGLDGLAVVKNKANNYLDDLTMEQLSLTWGPVSEGTIVKWNQIDPSFPAEDIDLYGPGTDSGTFDFFTEHVNGEAGASRGDYTPSEDDNVLVTGVMNSRYALGYFGYAYYSENKDKLKLLAVNGGDGCTKPSMETVRSLTYKPLSRPLFIYVRTESLEQPAVINFVKFYLKTADQLATEVGYVPVSVQAAEKNQRILSEALSAREGTP